MNKNEQGGLSPDEKVQKPRPMTPDEERAYNEGARRADDLFCRGCGKRGTNCCARCGNEGA